MQRSEIPLTRSLFLVLEAVPRGARFVVMRDGSPEVCRTATRKELARLIDKTPGRVFSGRLQFLVSLGHVQVVVKKRMVATISARCFAGHINEMLRISR